MQSCKYNVGKRFLNVESDTNGIIDDAFQLGNSKSAAGKLFHFHVSEEKYGILYEY